MNKIILYVISGIAFYSLNEFIIQPSIEKDKQVKQKPSEQHDKKLDYIPKLVPERYNG